MSSYYLKDADRNNSLVLDFSDLLPTQQQIESFNSLSTGNTPTHTPPDPPYSDRYSPPMSSSFLHGAQTQSAGLKLLTDWLDTLFTGIDLTRRLRPQDYNVWKAFLSSRNFSREEYKSALLYAADKVAKAEAALADLQAESRVVGLVGYQAGILTGIPLTTLRWEDVVKDDEVGRMSGMELRSGILQACGTLFALSGALSVAKEEKMAVDAGAGVDGGMEMAEMGPVNPDEIELDL